MFAVLLFALLQAAPSGIPADLAQELQDIKDEQVAIMATEKTLTAELAWLKKRAYQIKDSDDLLERGLATLKTEDDILQAELGKHEADMQAQHTESKAVGQDIVNWNARCDRLFDRETEMAQYNACLAEKGPLESRIANSIQWSNRVDASRDRLMDKTVAIEKQKSLLDQIIYQQGADEAELGNRADAYGDAVDKLDVRKSNLSDRSNAALDRLAEANAVSRECAEIAKQITLDSCKGKGDPSDPANWNTPCEKAARCLQKVWDGAR